MFLSGSGIGASSMFLSGSGIRAGDPLSTKVPLHIYYYIVHRQRLERVSRSGEGLQIWRGSPDLGTLPRSGDPLQSLNLEMGSLPTNVPLHIYYYIVK